MQKGSFGISCNIIVQLYKSMKGEEYRKDTRATFEPFLDSVRDQHLPHPSKTIKVLTHPKVNLFSFSDLWKFLVNPSLIRNHAL